MNLMFDAMNTVAAESWGLMATGISHGIGPGEETLTDINLIRLRQLIPSLRVTKFSKSVEAGNGADWEWWIGSSYDERWIKLRVQAKRSSHSGVRYDQLGHAVKLRDDDDEIVKDECGKSVSIKQYDTLIAQSLIDGAVPLHVFFNGWPEDRFLFDDRYHDAIAVHRRAARDGFLPSSAWNSSNWGCTVSSTETVKSIFEDPTVSDFPDSMLDSKQVNDNRYVPRYLTHSTPWAYLFRSRSRSDTPTIREIAQNLHQMQGADWELTDDEFLEMTYPNPSTEAEEAAFEGMFTLRKSISIQEERKRRDRWHRAQEFIRSSEFFSDLSRLFEGADEERQRPGYRLLLELDPTHSPFFDPYQRG